MNSIYGLSLLGYHNKVGRSTQRGGRYWRFHLNYIFPISLLLLDNKRYQTMCVLNCQDKYIRQKKLYFTPLRISFCKASESTKILRKGLSQYCHISSSKQLLLQLSFGDFSTLTVKTNFSLNL